MMIIALHCCGMPALKNAHCYIPVDDGIGDEMMLCVLPRFVFSCRPMLQVLHADVIVVLSILSCPFPLQLS